MSLNRVLMLTTLLTATFVCAPADAATSSEIIQKAIAEAGDPSDVGVLKVTVEADEVAASGESRLTTTTLWIDPANLQRSRLKLNNSLVLARNDGPAWATQNGVLDERPKTPVLADGTINQVMLPLMLPFSLELGGFYAARIEESSFEGRESWALGVDVAPRTFAVPSMVTAWTVHVDRSTYEVVALEYMPPFEQLKAGFEGARYRILKTTEVAGLTLPSIILIEGLYDDGTENGHTRTMRIDVKPSNRAEMELFMDPVSLEAFESGDVLEP